MSLQVKPKEKCRWDLVSLGEVMLRFDPGRGADATLACRPQSAEQRSGVPRLGWLTVEQARKEQRRCRATIGTHQPAFEYQRLADRHSRGHGGVADDPYSGGW